VELLGGVAASAVVAVDDVSLFVCGGFAISGCPIDFLLESLAVHPFGDTPFLIYNILCSSTMGHCCGQAPLRRFVGQWTLHAGKSVGSQQAYKSYHGSWRTLWA